ncbi:hypothetical protein MN608_00408 [Microdochium nivale]|nr:hypothetical protein MN608_00408 [Microdochium nivale]
MATGTSTPSSASEGPHTPQMEVNGDSYFPSTSTAHQQASSSSSTNTRSGVTTVAAATTAPAAVASTSARPVPVKQTSSGVGPYPLSALDRDHALPDDELDLDAQLAKPPLPRSLHSSLRAAAAAAAVSERTSSGSSTMAAANDAETRARRLAEAKKEWASWATN